MFVFAASLLLLLSQVQATDIPAYNGTEGLCGNDNPTTQQYLRLVEMAVTGSLVDEAGRCHGGKGGCALANLLPYDRAARIRGDDWPPFGHTMVGHLRLHNIRHTLLQVIQDDIPGHYAELGVWRGGSCIYAKALLNVCSQHHRKVLVFDAFESLPNYGGSTEFLANTEESVRHNFDKYGVLDSNVEFHQGLFKDTLPSFRKHHSDNIKLAVLRIDANFYDSYQDALYYLYDMVPVGGYVIFDDIGSHKAVLQSWNDFKKAQGVTEELIPIDKHGAYFRKQKAVIVNFDHMQPPRDANME